MVDDCVGSFRAGENVVILGDLNARVGDEEIDGVVGKNGVPGVNESGERMIEMCIERELVVGNTFFEKKDIHKYTWVRIVEGRVVDKALMDYVLVSRKVLHRLLDVRVLRGVGSGMSDHFLVEGRLRVGGRMRMNRRMGESRLTLKVSEFEKRDRCVEYQARIASEWEVIKEQEVGDVEKEWQRFKSVVVKCAEDVCGMRRVGGGVRRGGEWWCEETRLAVREKRLAFEVWLQKKDRESYERYKEKRNLAKRVIRNAKVKSDERWGKKMTDNFQENKKMFWKEVKRVRKGTSNREERVKDEDGSLLVERKAVERRWVEYFERLSNVQDNREAVISVMEVENGVNVLGNLNEDRISKEEVKMAVGELKTGKAAGLDGCAVEAVKNGGASLIEWLVRLLNVCFLAGCVPLDWRSACIVPLYKGKGDKFVCSNFRGISLLSVVGKLYGRVLIRRVREGTEGVIREEQGGFQKGKGCVDQIFAVRQICEKFVEKGREVFWAFMDLEKAYDRIDRDGMWHMLSLYGVGGKLLKGVKSFYVDSRACVRVGSGVSDWFPVKVGLRQGCVMSPWLFNVYMDGVVREVSRGVLRRGVRMLNDEVGEWCINQLLFADDTALVAESEEDLKRLVQEFGRVCKRRKLKVNVGKSKVMRCSRVRDGRRMSIVLDGEQLEEVSSFKYLGSKVAVDGKIGEEVSARVNEVSKVLGGMKTMFNCRSLRMDVKRRLYEGVAVPTALYGAETWNMGQRERKRLNVVEMRCLRSMCGVTRRDRIRNEEVRRRTGVTRELSGRADQSVLRWFGHTERMDEDRLVKRIVKSEVQGARPRGRPPLGWKDSVKRALDARGMTMEQGRVSVRNRSEWRAIVNE